VNTVEDALEVDVHAQVKVPLGRLEHRLGLVGCASVVDNKVDAAERLLGRGEGGLPRLALGDVAWVVSRRWGLWRVGTKPSRRLP
jgi:hypothetical protein